MKPSAARFSAMLLRPAKPEKGGNWSFVVLPKEASDLLPRRGRTGVCGTMNGHPFQALLEPDGQLSHWLKVDETLRELAGATPGASVEMEIHPMDPEPEPELPADLTTALAAAPEARATWNATTTIARIDWIHWIVTAKQEKTRAKRIATACDMLACGKKRVCCFDPSGYYSKAFSAPAVREAP